jgi:hypothetical protein
MPQTDAPVTPAPKAPAPRKPKPDATAATRSVDLYALTVDIAGGRLVGVERVDAGGERRALTAGEKAALAGAGAQPLRRLFERAFEAGIACVLGDRAEAEAPPAEEEAELSRVLLKSLIESSALSDLAADGALDGSVLRALVGQAAAATPA